MRTDYLMDRIVLMLLTKSVRLRKLRGAYTVWMQIKMNKNYGTFKKFKLLQLKCPRILIRHLGCKTTNICLFAYSVE